MAFTATYSTLIPTNTTNHTTTPTATITADTPPAAASAAAVMALSPARTYPPIHRTTSVPLLGSELGTRDADMGGKRTYDNEDEDGPVTPSLSEAEAEGMLMDAELNKTYVGGLSSGERTYNVWKVSSHSLDSIHSSRLETLLVFIV